jgi:hypothetical protein
MDNVNDTTKEVALLGLRLAMMRDHVTETVDAVHAALASRNVAALSDLKDGLAAIITAFGEIYRKIVEKINQLDAVMHATPSLSGDIRMRIIAAVCFSETVIIPSLVNKMREIQDLIARINTAIQPAQGAAVAAGGAGAGAASS